MGMPRKELIQNPDGSFARINGQAIEEIYAAMMLLIADNLAGGNRGSLWPREIPRCDDEERPDVLAQAAVSYILNYLRGLTIENNLSEKAMLRLLYQVSTQLEEEVAAVLSNR